ncbi:hypothetical protein ACIBI9_39445 [Nonomuraea sp. NPDC050451]|uniref:hypothetical protein n=1 Tax=Nonomuraea sp. NPDC050451 TaxID=3364364 RepID=UPI0037B37186
MTEEPLTGGNNALEVVRIGDTVRRARDAGAAFAARVLAHLESAGYPHAPRHLGIDEQGRDILSFIPGTTTDHPAQRAPGAYAAGGRMLRELRDGYGRPRFRPAAPDAPVVRAAVRGAAKAAAAPGTRCGEGRREGRGAPGDQLPRSTVVALLPA